MTLDSSYRLVLPDDAIDAVMFELEVVAIHRLVADGHAPDALPGVAEGLTGDDVAALQARLSTVLSTWRGTPYVELGDAAVAVAERARLEEVRLVALEDRALLRLAWGQQAVVAAELDSLVRAYPFRESLRVAHAVALAASGRQADALQALREARGHGGAELWADPGPMLRAVELAVLRQEALVEVRAAASAGSPSSQDEVRSPPPRMIGRQSELDTLTATLTEAAAGRPQFALVVG